MFQVFEPLIHTKLFWISSVVTVIYLYFKYVVYRFWDSSKVPVNDPIVPLGNSAPVVFGRLSLGNFFKESYETFRGKKFHGLYMFHKPFLVINDPELIRQILIKEFNRFPDRGLYFNDKIDPMSNNLFFLPGEKWRKLRAKLSPTFTSGKLKQMFPLLMETGTELVKVTDKLVKQQNGIVDVKDLASRYTADSISSIAFGYNCNSLENPENDFRKYSKMALVQNPIKNAVGLFAPVILDILKIPLIPRVVNDFYIKIFSDMVDQRHKTNIIRKDFLNLLMQLIDYGKLEGDDGQQPNSTGSQESSPDKINVLEATAQAFVFFLAGYETSSSTITYCLYELARNPDVQEKLQREIDDAINSSTGLTYEKILSDMDYLHMVFNETLRIHPSLPFLNRVCIDDYRLPESDLLIKKGTGIVVSVTGLHHDPKYFPSPEKFDPERFNKENIANRPPYTYFPFGEGPRVCIGSRFGIIQTKIALVVLLAEYTFSVCDKTPIPVQYSKDSVVQCPATDVCLKLEKRKI